jgi:hypothetical protein
MLEQLTIPAKNNILDRWNTNQELCTYFSSISSELHVHSRFNLLMSHYASSIIRSYIHHEAPRNITSSCKCFSSFAIISPFYSTNDNVRDSFFIARRREMYELENSSSFSQYDIATREALLGEVIYTASKLQNMQRVSNSEGNKNSNRKIST